MAEILLNSYTQPAAPDTTLSAAYTPGDGVLNVTSLPATVTGGSFRVKVGSTLYLVTGLGAGNVAWTVPAGAVESTVDAAHLSGADVYIIPTAGGLNAWLGDQTLDNHLDVDLTGAANGDYLKRVGGVWTPATPPGFGGILQSYLGYNTIGGSTEVVTNYRQYMKKISPTSAGQIVSIGVYLDGTANVLNMGAALLTDDSNSPDLIIATLPSVRQQLGADVFGGIAPQGATEPRWVDLPVAFWVPAAGDYWIAVQPLFEGGGTFHFYYDGSGSDKYLTAGGAYLADGPVHAITTSALKYSIRAGFIS
jgi:hypothetical protein